MPIFTLDQIKTLSPDTKSITAAKKLSTPRSWIKVAQDGNILWATVSGSSDIYYLYADTTNVKDARCCCPSGKHPCKHILAMLMLESGGHPFPAEAMPRDHKRDAEDKRYSSGWE